MELYYLPANLDITVANEFSITHSGSNYRISDGCPNRPVTGEKTYVYTEIDPWGHVVDSGTTNMDNSSRFLVGEGCEPNPNDIQTVELSPSIFNAPNFSPYEPIYFLGFIALSIFIFRFAFGTLFGRGWN